MTTPTARILVVDDEPQIRRFLRLGLTAAGYRVDEAGSVAEAEKLAAAIDPDLIVLDLGLPDRDGKVLIADLRRRSDVPVIVLSARDIEAEKIAALDLGADDYVAKPFGIGELLARVRAALRGRRRDAAAPEILRVGALVVDGPAHRVTLAGEPVKLTPKEFDLLALLAAHAGRVLPHRTILTKVWGPGHAEDTQYLRVFVGQLRAKLEADPAMPTLILTEPGVGYRLADTEEG